MYPEHKKYQFMALVYRKATKIVFGQCQNSSSVNYCQIEATGWPKKLDDIRGRLFHTQFWPQKSNRIIFKICPYSRRKSIMMTGLLYIYILLKRDFINQSFFSESEFDSHVEFITQNAPRFAQVKAKILNQKSNRLSRAPRHTETLKARLKIRLSPICCRRSFHCQILWSEIPIKSRVRLFVATLIVSLLIHLGN